MTMNKSASHIDDINHANNDTGSELLPTLPNQLMHEHIASFSLNVCGMFAQTSCAAEKETAFLRLLPSAVDSEPESYQHQNETSLAAIAILKRHPELLFQKGIVTDHFGRNIWGSAYQLFLGTGDTWALKQVHDIILPMIPNGEAQAKIHFQRQFPNCPLPYKRDLPEETLYDERNRKQVAEIIEQLNLIAASINDDPCTNGRATLPATTQAVVALRQLFAPKEDEVIRSGLHFPFAIMKEIYRVYKNRFDHWQRSDRLAFYSREIIGAAEAALSAVDSQCCKNGIGIFDLVKGPDRTDSLFCRHPKGNLQEFAPIGDKLGHSMFVDPFDGHTCLLAPEVGFYRWYNKTGHVSLFSDKFKKSAGGKWAVRWFEHHMNTRSDNIWTILSNHTKATRQLQQQRP